MAAITRSPWRFLHTLRKQTNRFICDAVALAVLACGCFFLSFLVSFFRRIFQNEAWPSVSLKLREGCPWCLAATCFSSSRTLILIPDSLGWSDSSAPAQPATLGKETEVLKSAYFLITDKGPAGHWGALSSMYMLYCVLRAVTLRKTPAKLFPPNIHSEPLA